jgi:maltose alpha-D-glucosyltransferase/alpha-amylase
MDNEQRLSVLKINSWKDLLSRDVLEELENNILPNYMMHLRWFGGKGRGMENLKIIDHAVLPMEPNNAYILLMEVSYRDGMPDLYQLPVAFGKGQFSYKIQDNCPQSVIALLDLNGEEGVLYDAIYGLELQQLILTQMAHHHTISQGRSELHFAGNKRLKKHVLENPRTKPRVISAEQSNTSITYDNTFYLKIYRKVDRAINPDVEISQYLSNVAHFKHIPGYVGTIEWKFGNETMVLGMMQEMVTSTSDGWAYMLDRLDDYNEKLLSQNDLPTVPAVLSGSLTSPLSYEQIPEDMKELLEGTLAEQVRLLGIRTGEMHLALSSGNDLPAFKPESFSLHYQRSLFSSLQSLVRVAFQSLNRNIKGLSPEVRKEAEEVLKMKDEILGIMKQIYSRKIDVSKIRIHGDYHLGQVLFTGKDFLLLDFEGEPARSYSERRLKYSALRDVAGMIRSFHYAAYGSLFLDNQIRPEDIGSLVPYVELWYHYISGFFMKAYLKTVDSSSFIPNNEEDLDILLQTYLLQKAVYELNYELNNRPDWVIVPLRGIKAIVKKNRKVEA